MSPSRGVGRRKGAAASRFAGRRGRALVALYVSILASAAVAATLEVPAGWSDAEPAALRLPTDPLASVWSSLAAALPGTAHTSWFVLACLSSVALSTATAWLGYQLFRGPGRVFAAVTAAPLTCAAVGHWLREQSVEALFPTLPFSIIAVLAVTALVRPLVHIGRLTPVACARSLGAASAGAVVLPSAGFGLLGACALVCVARGRRLAHFKGAPEDASLSHATMSGSVWTILAAGMIAPTLAGIILWSTHTDPAAAWRWIQGVHVASPPLDRIRAHVNPYLIYPGLALIVLMVAPLRWRGGVTLFALTGSALVLASGDQPLAPMPILLAALSLAATGWIWLAGSVVRRPVVGRILALPAAAALLWFGLGDAPSPSPVAARRHVDSVARLVDESLVVPGDVLLLHDADLYAELVRRHREWGARPDLKLVDARALSSIELTQSIEAWRAERRGLLSDSFNLGGRRMALDAVDAGPFFRFAADSEPAPEHRPIELRSLPVDLSLSEHRRWNRMHLERSRFWRARGSNADAVSALPLVDERASLRTAVRVSRAVNLPAEPGSELGHAEGWEMLPPEIPALAEAGDILFGAGEHELGAAMLSQAAEGGYAPAWRALARWHLRAGEIRAGEEILAILARDPERRREAVEVLWWMLWQERTMPAIALREQLAPVDREATTELAVRLALLRSTTHAR